MIQIDKTVNSATFTNEHINKFAAKKMRKKKIIFSSSGGTPAMKFLLDITEHFGENDVELIAARIAATCMKSRIVITATADGGVAELYGNTAKCVKMSAENTMELESDNITVNGTVLCINNI